MNRFSKIKIYTVRILLAAIAILLPIGLAGPAHAVGEPTISIGGCTATIYDPTHAGFNSAGTKLVKFAVKIECDGWRTATIHQRAYEEDSETNPPSWYYLGFKEYKKDFLVPWRSSETVSWTTTLPNTEPGNEEMLQKVRLSVSKDGVNTGWSPWKNSRIQSMPN